MVAFPLHLVGAEKEGPAWLALNLSLCFCAFSLTEVVLEVISG